MKSLVKSLWEINKGTQETFPGEYTGIQPPPPPPLANLIALHILENPVLIFQGIRRKTIPYIGGQTKIGRTDELDNHSSQ